MRALLAVRLLQSLNVLTRTEEDLSDDEDEDEFFNALLDELSTLRTAVSVSRFRFDRSAS